MQIATWNVNSITVRLEQVLQWLKTNRVDVLALQEIKCTDDKFPFSAFEDIGYNSVYFGQKTYNGVALLLKQEASCIVKNIPGFEDHSSRVLSTTIVTPNSLEKIRIIDVYIPNGQALDSEKFNYKLQWLTHLKDWLQGELKQYPLLVLLGDFNITFDDDDVWDPEGMRDGIYCSPIERTHLQKLLSLGMHDSMRLCPQPEKNFSWWDYRNFSFRRNRGMRIDHIFISNALLPVFVHCDVHRDQRENERPSDHVPVVLELNN
jgi:exodeoxyribonuclease III